MLHVPSHEGYHYRKTVTEALKLPEADSKKKKKKRRADSLCIVQPKG